jgi:nucleotide-binding universal stress UspA family protein
VAVLSVARVHGSGLGLPHPGLLPSPRERREQLALVEGAVARLRRAGVAADGQVVVTRKAARTISRVATLRHADAIVIDAAAGGRLRRLVEGDTPRAVARRFAGHVEVITACRAC